MSDNLLDFLNNDDLSPDFDIFGDSGEEIVEVKSSYQGKKEKKEEKTEVPQFDETQDDFDIYEDLQENYDVGFESSNSPSSLFVKVGAICLYAIILFLAIIGALTVIMPNVRMELLATFLN